MFSSLHQSLAMTSLKWRLESIIISTRVTWFLIHKNYGYPDVLSLAYNSSTQKTEAGESHWLWGQTGLHSKFHASLVYTVRKITMTKNYRGKDLFQLSGHRSSGREVRTIIWRQELSRELEEYYFIKPGFFPWLACFAFFYTLGPPAWVLYPPMEAGYFHINH